MSIQIREHHPGRDVDAFIRLPELLYAGDPGFVMPLLMEQRDRLNPAKNPFFQHLFSFCGTKKTPPCGSVERKTAPKLGGSGAVKFFMCSEEYSRLTLQPPRTVFLL